MHVACCAPVLVGYFEPCSIVAAVSNDIYPAGSTGPLRDKGVLPAKVMVRKLPFQIGIHCMCRALYSPTGSVSEPM